MSGSAFLDRDKRGSRYRRCRRGRGRQGRGRWMRGRRGDGGGSSWTLSGQGEDRGEE